MSPSQTNISDQNIKQQLYERFKLYCSLRVKLAVD